MYVFMTLLQSGKDQSDHSMDYDPVVEKWGGGGGGGGAEPPHFLKTPRLTAIITVQDNVSKYHQRASKAIENSKIFWESTP